MEKLLPRSRVPLLAAVLAASACGPPDVEEQLRCRVAADGTSEVVFEVTFPETPDGEADEAEAARRQRIEDLRQLYAEGWDPWAARFARAGRAGETLSWEKANGRLRRLVRTARLESPEALADFFADTDLTVVLTPGPAESELAVYAGSSSRATRAERKRLEKLLARWSRAAAAYLREVAGLYDYLDTRQERAEPIFRAIFEDDDGQGLEDREEERLERLLGALFAVLETAESTDEKGVRLERLAQLVYDPFPARLVVEIDGRLLAREGFVASAGGGYEIPPLGLEHALGNLEARWIDPPLLTTYQELERLGEAAAFDVGAYARLRRRVAPLPSPTEITEAVEEALAPAAEYRLRWRPGEAGAD